MSSLNDKRPDMIFIGGVNSKVREIGPGELETCSHCSKESYQIIKESYDSFSLFFIPLLPFNRKIFSSCSNCGTQKAISSEQRTYYRDLAQLNLLYLNNLIEEKEYFLRKQTLKKPQ